MVTIKYFNKLAMTIKSMAKNFVRMIIKTRIIIIYTVDIEYNLRRAD